MDGAAMVCGTAASAPLLSDVREDAKRKTTTTCVRTYDFTTYARALSCVISLVHCLRQYSTPGGGRRATLERSKSFGRGQWRPFLRRLPPSYPVRPHRERVRHIRNKRHEKKTEKPFFPLNLSSRITRTRDNRRIVTRTRRLSVEIRK